MYAIPWIRDSRWARWSIAALCCLISAGSAANAQLDATAQASKRQAYTNDRYAFRLSYPADGQQHTLRDGRHQHVQIKNFDDAADTERALESGDYVVDIFIYDQRVGHKPGARCNELLSESSSAKLGRVRALRGKAEARADGSTAFAVCVESHRLEILVTGAEQDPLGPVVNRILDSVRFGN